MESDQVEADLHKVIEVLTSRKTQARVHMPPYCFFDVWRRKVNVAEGGNALVMTTGQVKKLACCQRLDKDVLELCISYDVSDDVAGLVDD